jgi:4-amino-4-deoxy-L-arabinose transferase-like glycosyltransferase
VYRLFGIENYQAARLFQIGISLLTSIIIYRLGTSIFSPRVGLLAAALCCFYPSLLGHNLLLLTEVLFTFWLCLFAYAVVQFFHSRKIAWIALAGAILGLAALTRSVVWPFPLVLIVLILAARRFPWPKRLTSVAILLCTFLAVVAPWVIRNTRLEKAFTLIDSNGARILQWSLRARAQQRSGVAAQPVRNTHAASTAKTQGRLEQEALVESIQRIKQTPSLVLWQILRNGQSFWRLDRELLAAAQRGWYGALSRPVLVVMVGVICGYYATTMITALFGVTLPVTRDRLIRGFYLAIIAHFWIIHSMVYGHSRYHIPVMPLVMIFSASALLNWRELFRAEHRQRCWVGIAASALLVAIWIGQFAQDSAAFMRGPAGTRIAQPQD